MPAWKIYWGRVYENIPIMTSYTNSTLTRQHSHSFDQGNPLGEKNAKLAMLLTLALSLPVFMALWFAPALVFFNGMAPVDALKASFNACAKNGAPFLVYQQSAVCEKPAHGLTALRQRRH